MIAVASVLARSAILGFLLGLFLAVGCARDGTKRGSGSASAGLQEPKSRVVAAVPTPAVSNTNTNSNSTWVGRALNGEVNVADAPALRGREQEFFLELLARLVGETREVDEVIREAARRLAVLDAGRGGVVVARELWARECCMRRSYLAGGLRGLADGLGEVAPGGILDAGAALMLGELAEHPDVGVAEAARAARGYFRTGESPRERGEGGSPDPSR
ncbi:MAG: hypothetical protein AB7O66_03000 [Limisphaerales bacterium]